MHIVTFDPLRLKKFQTTILATWVANERDLCPIKHWTTVTIVNFMNSIHLVFYQNVCGNEPLICLKIPLN